MSTINMRIDSGILRRIFPLFIFWNWPLVVVISISEKDHQIKMPRIRRMNRCEECGYSTANNYNFILHVRTHTGEKPFSCDVCGDTFAQKSNLVTHLRRHNDIKPYECDVCDAAFAYKESLIVHKRTHTGEKPFKCNECDASFADAGNLKRHQVRHSGEKRFVCTYCQKAFAHSSTLKNHVRTHTGERPYKCDECDAAFAQQGDLVKHQRNKHTGERPYKCDECDAAFTESGNLQKHKAQVHARIKPFECDQCGALFAAKNNFLKHCMRHTTERPHKCEHCDAGFVDSGDLKKHLRIHDPKYISMRKRQEERVRSVLRDAGYDFKSEHQIDFSCAGIGTFARIDIVLMVNGGIIMLEVDEDQHKFGDYSVACDMKRMANVMESLAVGGNSLPVMWLRYNPGSFTVNGVKRRIHRQKKEAALMSKIECVSFDTPMSIHYMFYDVDNHKLAIHSDPQYHSAFKSCCSFTIDV